MNEKLNMSTLREQVYLHLRELLHNGRYLPGSTIHIGETAKRLGVSKTPLRDAFIQLELEGFVAIQPRRAIRVNGITLRDVRNAYEIVGALESSVILDCFDRIEDSHIRRMEEVNDQMIADIGHNDFGDYYTANLEFHDIYLALSDNDTLRKMILPIKQRLYDFPRKSYINEWELRNCWEHVQFIDAVKKGDRLEAARLVRDVHWSYSVQESFIRKFHSLVVEEIKVQRRRRTKAVSETKLPPNS